MNLQSIFLLALIVVAAVVAIRRYWRRPHCTDGGACQGCALKEKCAHPFSSCKDRA